MRVLSWLGRKKEVTDLIERDARAWDCSREVAMKLHLLEKHVNEFLRVDVIGRLGDLELHELWRQAVQWIELRTEWQRLADDPATSEGLREACRGWLVEYSEEKKRDCPPYKPGPQNVQ